MRPSLAISQPATPTLCHGAGRPTLPVTSRPARPLPPLGPSTPSTGPCHTLWAPEVASPPPRALCGPGKVTIGREVVKYGRVGSGVGTGAWRHQHVTGGGAKVNHVARDSPHTQGPFSCTANLGGGFSCYCWSCLSPQARPCAPAPPRAPSSPSPSDPARGLTPISPSPKSSNLEFLCHRRIMAFISPSPSL